MTGNPREGVAARPAGGGAAGRGQGALVAGSGARHARASTSSTSATSAPALEVLERMRAVGEDLNDVRLQAEAAWIDARIHTVQRRGGGGGDGGPARGGAGRRSRGQGRRPGWLGAAELEAADTKLAIQHLEDALERLQELSRAGGYRYRQVDGMLRALVAEAYLGRGPTRSGARQWPRRPWIARKGGWARRHRLRGAGAAVGSLSPRAGWTRPSARSRRPGHVHGRSRRGRRWGAHAMTLGELHAARGDRSAAAAELRAAHDLFSQMRAPRLVERVSHLAAALGVSLESSRLVVPRRPAQRGGRDLRGAAPPGPLLPGAAGQRGQCPLPAPGRRPVAPHLHRGRRHLLAHRGGARQPRWRIGTTTR